MKTVAVTTGIRSEYDILFSIMKAIKEHPDLVLKVIVTGAHLSDSYGYTIQEIEKDGFEITQSVESLLDSDSATSRVKSASIQLMGLVQTFNRIKPDILVAFGDREEAINVALCGAYMNIPVAHVSGGDLVVGNVDDYIRHAVTKLAHLHFPTTKENADRIIKMGEEPWRVHTVGNAGIDRLLSTVHISREELNKRLGFDLNEGPIILLIQQVISSEIDQAASQMRITMEAIKELEMKTVVNYPNSDAGGRQIIKVINDYAPRFSFIKTFKNLPRVEFVNLLRTADVLVGNSSCGILEAPSLKLPVVNIGNRQKKRQHAENVIFVPHDKEKIKEAIKKALYDEEFKEIVQNCTNPYGDGHTGERIANILGEVKIDEKLLVKDMTY